jgi:hypothetical protein
MHPWVAFAIETAAKLPIEKFIVRPPDRKRELEELKDILIGNQGRAAVEPTQSKVAEPEPMFFPKASHTPSSPPKVLVAKPVQQSDVTTQDTVDYQNREIGKLLLRMERHLAQKMRIKNIPCDCGAPKHLIDLEGMVEETIPMVTESKIYYRILDWIRDVGPTTTLEAVKSGKHNDEYPAHSREARDLRKELLGTLASEALFPKHEPLTANTIDN